LPIWWWFSDPCGNQLTELVPLGLRHLQNILEIDRGSKSERSKKLNVFFGWFQSLRKIVDVMVIRSEEADYSDELMLWITPLTVGTSDRGHC
jgi:hypothetical protein